MNDWRKLGAHYLLNNFTANLSHSNNGLLKVVIHNPLSFLPLFILIVLVILSVYILRFVFRLKKSIKETSVILEITPPSHTEKTAYTTTQLFSTFHGLINEQTMLDKLLGKKERLSFEIVSSKNEGIRYLLRTTPNQVNNVKKNLTTYLPDVSIKKVDDYLLKDFGKSNELKTQVVEYRLGKSFAFPLQKQNQLEEHDPVGYITGMMTKLSPNELISFQIVLSPVKTSETQIIQNMIRGKRDVFQYLSSPSYHWVLRLIFGVITLLTTAIKEVGGALISVVNEAQSSPDQIRRMRAYELESKMRMNNFKNIPKILTPYEEELIQSIQGKIAQPLFTSSIRLLVIAKNKQELKERINGFNSSLSTFSDISNQSLKIKKGILNLKKIRIWLFKKRLISLVTSRNDRYAQALSASELSDLFHFPFTRVTQTENIVKTYSKELPAPISLKQDTAFDVTFGKNTYGGEETVIGLTKDQRARHMVIFGGTGNGKTTLILEMIKEDIQNGKGICFIDPHGDAAERVLQMVPKNREKDVVWIDPYDIDYPLALNLMELTPNLNVNDSLREKERIAESIVALFRRICSSEFSRAGNNAFRIEYTLRNAIYTAFTIKNCTLFTIYDLLNDPALLKDTVNKLDNERLKTFWRNEFGRAGDYQVVKMVGGVTARIGRFLNSESARRIFEQPISTVKFDELMDSHKIIICNLSKGKLSEDISQVLGTTILTKIQLATMKRAQIPEDDRVPFFLYVDEFQNYATESFVEMLSEARKYKLNIIIVEQSTSQQFDQNLVDVILANVAIVICFRTANPADELIILGQFAPFVKEGEIMNLPWFHFFIKIYAQVSQEAFSGETIPLKIKFDKQKMERIIKLSKEKYQIAYVSQKTEQKINATNTNKSEQGNAEKRVQKTALKSGPPDEN
jgi:hypothetical protein